MRMDEKQADAANRVSWAQAATLFGVSLLISLAVVEGISRLLIPNRYFVWPPNFSTTFDARENIPHGISFPSRLTINAAGMRGDLPGESHEYRILAVGGSTTICVYLDDARAWPFLLQEYTNERLGRDHVWVGNVGRPGHRTAQHILQLDRLLKQHPELDMVVLMLGINDFLVDLLFNQGPSRSASEDPRTNLLISFSIFPGWDEDSAWYERNLIGRMRRLRSWRPLPGVGELRPMDEKGEFVAALRRDRQNANRIRQDLPDLTLKIAEYAEHVNEIIDIATQNEVRILLVTQPTLWNASLSPKERSLLWAGGPIADAESGESYYLSVEALAKGIQGYNDVLLGTCRKRDSECLDVVADRGHTPTAFYDDIPFTERGSAMLAGLISNYLLESPPLNQATGRYRDNR
jgi:hypothetical protein